MSIDIKILRALDPPLFAGVGGADIEALAGSFATVGYRAQELVFSRGDPSDYLLLIMEGRLRLSLSSPDGREISFRVAGPRESVGEMGALDGGPRSADATAMESVRALALMRADLERLCDERPGLNRALIAWLCRRLRETTDQLEGVALLDVEQRLARFLLALAKNGTTRADGRVRVSLTHSQTEIGHLLGASRPKVNVAIAGLEQAKLIERAGNEAFIDVAKLAARAGVDL